MHCALIATEAVITGAGEVIVVLWVAISGLINRVFWESLKAVLSMLVPRVKGGLIRVPSPAAVFDMG